ISSPLMDNITDVFAKQGYTKIYEFTPIKGKAWYSPKIGGSGTWEDTREASTYFLVKESDSLLSTIPLSKQADTYLITTTIDNAIKNAQTYNKK
ncbi:MAG: hypothetical protein ACRC0X_03895, partial [Brevinema sp.]